MDIIIYNAKSYRNLIGLITQYRRTLFKNLIILWVGVTRNNRRYIPYVPYDKMARRVATVS